MTIVHSHIKKHPRGSMLIELTVAMGLLTAVGLILLRGSLDVMLPRQWVIQQNITDSYLTYEESYAKRISFEEFTASDSDWPEYPSTSTNTVELGKMPGGLAVTGTVVRTRIADDSNVPDPSESDYASKLAANPAKMETWKLQSHLTYTIGNNTYLKSRTVVRTR